MTSVQWLAQNLIVLGANSDIGKTLVLRACADPSRRVLAVSRSPVRYRSGEPNNTMHLDGIDLTSALALQSLADKAVEVFERPFTAVHCVGDFWVHKPLVETSFDEIRRMIESHFVTLCGVARFLTPVMLRNGGGRLVAFSCNSVAYHYPDMAPFTASKAAVETFVRCYAHENAEYAISAFSLTLPTIRTEKVLRTKPNGDHANYITPDQLVAFILEHVLTQPHEASGNVLKLFKHSPTFYRDGYFTRNPRRGEFSQSTTDDV